MMRLKLKAVIGAIPFLGFVIVLFWGMFSVYAINRRRIHAFIYAFISIMGTVIVLIPAGLGLYFFMQSIDLTNTLLLICGLLFICLAGLYLSTAVCLAVQYLYCKKLVARQNTQYLS